MMKLELIKELWKINLKFSNPDYLKITSISSLMYHPQSVELLLNILKIAV